MRLRLGGRGQSAVDRRKALIEALVSLERQREIRMNSYQAAHRDRQFLEEAKATGVDVTPVSAANLRRAIEEMSRASPEILDYVRKLLAVGKGG